MRITLGKSTNPDFDVVVQGTGKGLFGGAGWHSPSDAGACAWGDFTSSCLHGLLLWAQDGSIVLSPSF